MKKAVLHAEEQGSFYFNQLKSRIIGDYGALAVALEANRNASDMFYFLRDNLYCVVVITRKDLMQALVVNATNNTGPTISGILEINSQLKIIYVHKEENGEFSSVSGVTHIAETSDVISKILAEISTALQ